MPLDPLELSIALMRIDSTSGREGEVVRFAQGVLESEGWIVRRIPVSEGRDNIFATAADAPLVTLSTHLDTVPPFIAPRVEGTRLWGRGACDAKGIAAAMICAAERLRARDVPVALLFVVGEEVTHDGAHAANAWPTTSRALINGEPTESTLAVGTKGALRLMLPCARRGRTLGVPAPRPLGDPPVARRPSRCARARVPERRLARRHDAQRRRRLRAASPTTWSRPKRMRA